MKKITALFLLIGMLLSFAAGCKEYIPPESEIREYDPDAKRECVEYRDEGIYGFGVYRDGTAVITFVNASGDIEIPSSVGGYPVTALREDLFSERSDITSVTIPESVTEIGDYAFYGCSSLNTVTLPATVSEIGTGAFNKTPWLENSTETFLIVGDGILLRYQPGDETGKPAVEVPEGVKKIGAYAFYSTPVSSVRIPEGVTSIGAYSFHHCEYLTTVAIPSTVTELGMGAFSNCGALTRAEIPEGVEVLPDAVFSECYSLSSVNIPKNTYYIGDSAFYACYLVSELTIPKTVTEIGFEAFTDTAWEKNLTGEFVVVGYGILLKYNGNQETVRIPK